MELAERSEQKAKESELYARGMSYRSETQRAYEHFSRGDLVGASRSLATQIPTEGMNDLRGIEWRLLDAEINAKRCMLGSHTGPATACVLYPNEDLVATAGEDGLVQLWDLVARKRLRSFNPKIGQIHAMAISPDGKTLAVGGTPSAGLFGFAAVHLLDSVTGAAKAVIQPHKTTIESIQFSPDGKSLAAGSRYEEVKLTTIAGKPSHSFTNTDRNVSIAFSADSRFLATAWEKKKLFRIWDCQSGDVVRDVECQDYVHAIRWSPEGGYIAVSGKRYPWIDAFDAADRSEINESKDRCSAATATACGYNHDGW